MTIEPVKSYEYTPVYDKYQNVVGYSCYGFNSDGDMITKAIDKDKINVNVPKGKVIYFQRGVNMRHCKKCGSELRENSKFCLKCGAPVSMQQIPVYNAPTKNNKRLPIIIGSAAGILALLAVILITGLVIPGWLRKTKDSDSEVRAESSESSYESTVSDDNEIASNEEKNEDVISLGLHQDHKETEKEVQEEKNEIQESKGNENNTIPCDWKFYDVQLPGPAGYDKVSLYEDETNSFGKSSTTIRMDGITYEEYIEYCKELEALPGWETYEGDYPEDVAHFQSDYNAVSKTYCTGSYGDLPHISVQYYSDKVCEKGYPHFCMFVFQDW